MASLGIEKGGTAVIQFMMNGKRHSIGLGRLDREAAALVLGHVQFLVNAAKFQIPIPESTAKWLKRIDPKIHRRIARVNLTAPRTEVRDRALGAMIDAYIKSKVDIKERTKINLQQAKLALVNYFGASRDFTTINAAEVRDWQASISARLARATVSGHTKKAKQFFRDAVLRKSLDQNPFDGLKCGSQKNQSRQFFITREMASRVMDACPNAEWRLVFALSRLAGLRVPSELYLLKWSDIDFDRGRMIINSPKTAHHEGRATRTIPLFKALRPYLMEAFEAAPDGAVHVIHKLRTGNLRTTANKIIKRAGLEPWPRTFQNLRASRETELAAEYPLHVVCDWIGNSRMVAQDHYLQITDANFTKAIGDVEQSSSPIDQH
jgi:integrase